MLVVKLGNINYRLGNLIKILLGVISVNLLSYKHNKISIKEVKNKLKCKIFDNFPDYYIFDEFTNDNKIIEDNFFRCYNNIFKLTSKQFDELIDKYLKPYINYDKKLDNIPNLDFENDLIIHIRSGDVFDKNDEVVNKDINSDVFKWFIQPPYSFYEKIIKENNYNKIYILTENCNNPIIPKIMKNFDNVYFLSNDFETDFHILLNSKNIVSSTSDFIQSAIYLSKNKNIIYSTRKNYYYSISHKFNVQTYDYDKYYNTKINSYDEKIYLMLNS
jgi:hypothetical protein